MTGADRALQGCPDARVGFGIEIVAVDGPGTAVDRDRDRTLVCHVVVGACGWNEVDGHGYKNQQNEREAQDVDRERGQGCGAGHVETSLGSSAVYRMHCEAS